MSRLPRFHELVKTAALAAVLFGLAACRDREITAYRIPKEEGDTEAATAAAAKPATNTNDLPPGHPAIGPEELANANELPPGHPAINTNDLPPGHPPIGGGEFVPPVAAPAAASGDNALVWQAPADWRAKAGSAVRKGSYAVGPGGAGDLSIIAFPGDVGGKLANVNRWRGQVGLPPAAEADLPGLTSEFESNGIHFILVEAAGTTASGAQRILAAMVSWQGATWFFKLAGPDEVVTGAKPAFLSFLRTVRAP